MPDGANHGELANLLADQFAALGDGRPIGARAVGNGDGVVFACEWPTMPADELLLAAGRHKQIASFRSEFLETIASSMAELVELDLGREVVGSEVIVGEDPRLVMLSFSLGEPKFRDREAVEGLRNWAVQVRHDSREKRLLYRSQREEFRRLRAEMRALQNGQSSP